MVVIVIALVATSAKAQMMNPQQALQSLFETGKVDGERFAPSFRSQIPAAEVARIVADLRQGQGQLLGVESSGGGFVLRFERGRVPARIALDDQGRIAGLWFGAPVPGGDIASQAKVIKALPGRTSLLVLSDGEVVVAHEAEVPLAVGSAAKLAVLLAAKRAVAEGRLAWDQVATLDPAWKSLPTGELQDWPAGTPVTIATLANLMISISDNTATDALIGLVGREAVEAVAPRNAPFLTTRELFILKARQNAGLREDWRAGEPAARRALLERIETAPLPAVSELSPEATHEVEWFLTARELCALLEATAGLPSLAINPGPAEAARWESVAYKGGSEVGVLNLSARLRGRDGRAHCVVVTWNDTDALEKARLVAPFRGILDRLADSRTGD